MTGTLYLLPVPVSEDAPAGGLSEAVKARAAQIDYFLVEAAKTARRHLKGALSHPRAVSELTIVEIGHEPDACQIDAWLAPLLEGRDAAVMSESGCPGIADPGATLVARAQALGITVTPLTGPSSIFLTLMASGLDGQRFRFEGYLPVHADERARALVRLQAESAKASQTVLFIETPYRNAAMLESLLAALDDTTRLCVATDVTGADESIRTLSVKTWKALPESERTPPKRPTVFAFLAQKRTEPRRHGAAGRGASGRGGRK